MAENGRRAPLLVVVCVVSAALVAGGIVLAGGRGDAARTALAYAHALREHDVTAMVALYGPGAVYDDPGLGTLLETREQIRDWYWNLFIPSTRFRVGAIVVDGDVAVVRWVWSGVRVWSDLEPYTIRGVSVLVTSGGHITHQTVYYDPSPFG